MINNEYRNADKTRTPENARSPRRFISCHSGFFRHWAHLDTAPDSTGHRGAPVSDPARFGALLNTCRVGDRRSGGSVKMRPSGTQRPKREARNPNDEGGPMTKEVQNPHGTYFVCVDSTRS